MAEKSVNWEDMYLVQANITKDIRVEMGAKDRQINLLEEKNRILEGKIEDLLLSKS